MLEDAFGSDSNSSCTLSAKVLHSHLEALEGGLNPGLSQGQRSPLEAVFAVYRSYKEHDYEDWEEFTASNSPDVCEKVEARLLREANRSLHCCQNDFFDKILYFLEQLTSVLSIQVSKSRLLWSSLKPQG